MSFFRKVKPISRLAIFIDYSNIAKEAANQFKIFNFEKLIEECLKIGIIEEAFVFIPDGWYNIPEVNKFGFEIILCQGVKDTSDKIEDRVDIHIIRRAWKLVRDPEITDFVLVGHDHHMLEWIKDTRFHNKKIHFFATDKLSYLLKEVKGIFNPLPLKDKR